MARNLKTYITSEGFFEKAVAAPSMKAALEAWGATKNLFQQGFAKETDDPEIIAATMEAPGVILKRAAGSDDLFKRHAELSHAILPEKPDEAVGRKNALKTKFRKKTERAKTLIRDKEGAKAFEQEKKRREKRCQKEESARKENEKKRLAAVKKARLALQESEKRYNKTLRALLVRQASVTKKIEAAETAWETERKRLEAAADKAKG